MLTAWLHHKRPAFSFLLFLAAGVAAISWQQPWLLVLPFAWVLFPIVFNYTVYRTEQLYWLLLIVLPLSTELQLTPYLGLDFPDEMLLMLLTGMSVLTWVHQPSRFPVTVLRHPLFLVIMLQLLWVLVCCIYAAEPLLAVKYFLAKTWFIIPFVVLPSVILSTPGGLKKMARCLLVPMLVAVMIILIRHAFYGFAFEDIYKTLTPFFRNHVNYSSMLVCLLPVAWCAYTLTPAANSGRKWLRFGMSIGAIALFFAYSRGAWIALLAGCGMAWVIRKKWITGCIIGAFVVVISSIAWLVTDEHYMRYAPDHDHTVFHTDFADHLRATVSLKDVSNAERFYRWVAGARMLAHRPVTGFGPNAFYLHYRPYTIRRFETWVSDNPEHSTVHNYFLLTALEQGVTGLLLFCVLYFGMLWRVQQLYHGLQNEYYRTIALATGIILTMVGVINCTSDMIETDKIGSLFWLCAGVIIILDEKKQEGKENLAVSA
ncbi:MAG: hypothetical protein NVSMB63_08860 [Sediminibacterium sp.]